MPDPWIADVTGGGRSLGFLGRRLGWKSCPGSTS